MSVSYPLFAPTSPGKPFLLRPDSKPGEISSAAQMNDSYAHIAPEFRHAELMGREDVAAQLYADELIEQLYDAGCRLLARGLPVLPINGKRPCNKSGHPMRKWQRVKCDAKRLLRGLQGARDPKPLWKTKQAPESEPGIGLRMGPGSVIDIETDSAEEVAAVKHLFRGVPLPKTVTYNSRRGSHFLFRHDARLAALGKDVFTYRAPDGNSVSIRIGGQGSGAQSVIPPSPEREWLPGRSFDEIEPAALPELVIERLLEQAGPVPEPVSGSADSPAAAPDAAPVPSLLLVNVIETPYHNLDDTTAAAIDNAVTASVPTQYHKRHESIFALVRRLKAIPGLQGMTRAWLDTPEGQEWLNRTLLDWYARGNHFFRGDYDECVYDFVQAWDKVKHPWGNKLEAAYQESLDEHLPAEVIKRLGLFDCENNRRLIKMIAVLQRRAGDKPFLLVQEACGKMLSLSQQSVSKKLKHLERLGLVKQTRKGKRKHASEYRYLGTSYGAPNGGAVPRRAAIPSSDSQAA